MFEEGFGFDGSSIRGWKSIEASDMLAMPDAGSAFIDPFCAVPTLSLTCTIAETGTKEAYSRDPRGMAQKGEKYLASTGLADAAVFGPEAEFFIFDNVQYDAKSNGCFYSIDSEEGIWNSGRDEMPNLGYKIRYKEGYFPVAPVDTQQDIRTEMVLLMEELGIKVERQHHEVATAGTWTAVSGSIKTIARILDWTGEALGAAFKLLGKLGGELIQGVKSVARMVSDGAGGALKALLTSLEEIGAKLTAYADELLGRVGRSGVDEGVVE